MPNPKPLWIFLEYFEHKFDYEHGQRYKKNIHETFNENLAF